MFRSFELVLGRMLIVVTFGKELEIALLGLARMILPQEATIASAYAYVELQLAAILKPRDGYFTISASLTPNSFLLTKDCHLTGGFAFSLWFGNNPHAGDFVVTIGGYHPAFSPPPWYPQVAPVGFNWPVNKAVTIKGGAYFALTPSAIMAGGSLEVLFHAGDLRAWLTAYANLLIRWKPFWFSASIGISIGVSYRLDLGFTTLNLTVELGATLDMTGPPISGIAHVHWYIISFDIPFGADPSTKPKLDLDWDQFQALLPNTAGHHSPPVNSLTAATAPAALVLGIHCNRGLLPEDQSGSAWIVRGDELIFTTSSAIPLSGIQLSATAVTMPGGVPSTINIRPMGLSGLHVTQTLTLTPSTVSRSRISPHG